MNKILLLTTRGCEGCSIMRTSIKQAIILSKKDIAFEEKDLGQLTKAFIQVNRIKDYPTVLFYKDDILKRKEVGSRPYIVVLRWIDIDF